MSGCALVVDLLLEVERPACAPCSTVARADCRAAAGSCIEKLIASTRKPSTPRSSQKRTPSSAASCTCTIVHVELRLARSGNCADNIGRAARPTSTPVRRTPTASWSAAIRRPWRPPRRTSRPCRHATARAAFGEPFMLVGGVRNRPGRSMTFSPSAVGFFDQRVEIGERPEHRVDPAIVGDVVAEIVASATV
jgi:hypothetical protein